MLTGSASKSLLSRAPHPAPCDPTPVFPPPGHDVLLTHGYNGLPAGCPPLDACSWLSQRRHSHSEASTSGRHALPSRRDSGRCSASRVSAPQRAVTQAYSSFKRRMRFRPAQDKPTGVGSDDGSNEINPCAALLSAYYLHTGRSLCCVDRARTTLAPIA